VLCPRDAAPVPRAAASSRRTAAGVQGASASLLKDAASPRRAGALRLRDAASPRRVGVLCLRDAASPRRAGARLLRDAASFRREPGARAAGRGARPASSRRDALAPRPSAYRTDAPSDRWARRGVPSVDHGAGRVRVDGEAGAAAERAEAEAAGVDPYPSASALAAEPSASGHRSVECPRPGRGPCSYDHLTSLERSALCPFVPSGWAALLRIPRSTDPRSAHSPSSYASPSVRGPRVHVRCAALTAAQNGAQLSVPHVS
jgi:hypothetical protein